MVKLMIIRKLHRITIVRSVKPISRNINEDLSWLGMSLGLFNLRDKDKSCFRIFIELLKAAKNQEPLTSDEIALRLGLTRGTVIHHINKLLESGLVLSEKNRYYLRVQNLKALIDELEKDVQRTMTDMKEIAVGIDQELGL